MKILFVVLCLVFLAVPAFSATYYVSPSGNDNNNGTTAPFRTLGKAAGLVNPGDTVVAAPGIYYENDYGKGQVGFYVRRGGNSAGPVMFQSASPGMAIIDGNNAVQVGVYVGAPYVQVQGFRVRNFTYQGIEVYGSYSTLKDNTINGNGNSTTVQPAYGHDGIFTDKSVTNALIDGNIIYGNGRLSLAANATGGALDQGIYLCSPNSTVQNNIIYGNQAFGIQVAGYVPLGSTLIQNNTITGEQNRGGIVLWQAGAKGCVIQNNTLITSVGWAIDFVNDGGGHVILGNRFNGPAINPAGAAQWRGTNP